MGLRYYNFCTLCNCGVLVFCGIIKQLKVLTHTILHISNMVVIGK